METAAWSQIHVDITGPRECTASVRGHSRQGQRCGTLKSRSNGATGIASPDIARMDNVAPACVVRFRDFSAPGAVSVVVEEGKLLTLILVKFGTKLKI